MLVHSGYEWLNFGTKVREMETDLGGGIVDVVIGLGFTMIATGVGLGTAESRVKKCQVIVLLASHFYVPGCQKPSALRRAAR